MSKKTKLALITILGLAAFLRLYHLAQHDVINDEAYFGYRSIGLIDSMDTPGEPAVFEKFSEAPLWARLSFHEAPPLAFWIEHLFFRLFGVSLLTMRLPFALFGIASVLLLFFIGYKLFASEFLVWPQRRFWQSIPPTSGFPAPVSLSPS